MEAIMSPTMIPLTTRPAPQNKSQKDIPGEDTATLIGDEARDVNDSETISGTVVCEISLINILHRVIEVKKDVWCRLSDLNQRPTDYKSVALPAELNRRTPSI